MVSTENAKTHVSSFSHHPWIRQGLSENRGYHIESSGDFLLLSLPLLFLLRLHQLHLECLILVLKCFFGPQFFLKALLLYRGFHLILVLQGIPPHLLLPLNTLFVPLPLLLLHLLLFDQLLIIFLQL